MKIALLGLDSIIEHGIRSISAYLKRHGHTVISVFFARYEHYLKAPYEEFIKKDLSDLKHLLSDCDLIGISCISFNHSYAMYLADQLKELNIPVVLGGIHPSLCPEECIKGVDIVCVGEGEEAIADLVNRLEKKKNIYDTPNFWFKKDGQIIKNPVRPLIEDLDSLPTPDFDVSGHYIFDGEKFSKFPIMKFRDHGIRYYSVYGCPHNCNYCCNLPIYQAFVNDKCTHVRNRKKSIDKIIYDLEKILSGFDFPIPFIAFDDDTFFTRSMQEFQEFAYKYKEKINIPFVLDSSPQTFDEQKFQLLLEAGLNAIAIGIQSGSERVNHDVFNRKVKNEKIMEVANIINKYQDKLERPPYYHILIQNPYEDKNDKIETLKLLNNLPKPYKLVVFQLEFLPHTNLYKRALADGIIKSMEDQLEYLSKSAATLRNIDLTKEIISLDDIIFIIRDRIDNVYYGVLHSNLIEKFLQRSPDQIPLQLRIQIPEELYRIIKKENPKESKFNQILYTLRAVTFLKEPIQAEEDCLPAISASFENYKLVKNMFSNYYFYSHRLI